MKAVLFVCLALLAVSHAFIGGDGMMQNMMLLRMMGGGTGGSPLGMFGGPAGGATTGQAQGASNPFSSLMTLAMLGEI